MKIKDCPACGAEDAIEAGLMLELDDVVLERHESRDYEAYRIVDATPGPNTYFREIGVEPFQSSNSYFQCSGCGKSFEVLAIADDVIGRWSYTPPDERERIATVVREALEGDSNDADHDALVEVAEHLGISYDIPED